jgi:GTP-binding protein HflX
MVSDQVEVKAGRAPDGKVRNVALVVCAFQRSRFNGCNRNRSAPDSDPRDDRGARAEDTDRDDRAWRRGDRAPNHADAQPPNRSFRVAEFEELARSAGFAPIETLVFNVSRINPATFIGSGQLESVKLAVLRESPRYVLVNLNLSPVHQRNWRSELGVQVLTRSDVIFDIFERNAHTAEGKLQVELARRRYDMPRVMLIFEEQSGARGGIGMRGLGEKLHLKTKGEIRNRIHQLEKRLEKIERDRRLRRSLRERAPVPLIALVGYTNAGKSSLLNVLTGASALVDDRYFATLNPIVRRLNLPNGRQVLISDTVGFIEDLPKELIAVFKATLEELETADIIVHVVDLSRPDAVETARSVEAILAEMKLDEIPRLTALNKSDAVADCDSIPLFLEKAKPAVVISALRKTGIAEALELMQDLLLAVDVKSNPA